MKYENTKLMDYATAEDIRDATDQERYDSIHAGSQGIITVDGVDCYVEAQADDDDFADDFVRRRESDKK